MTNHSTDGLHVSPQTYRKYGMPRRQELSAIDGEHEHNPQRSFKADFAWKTLSGK
jgi:hypothetical protein